MPTQRIPGFVHGAYPAQSPRLTVMDVRNLIPVPDESGTSGTNLAMLIGTPGHEAVLATLDGPIRGCWSEDGICLVAGSTHVYRVTYSAGVGWVASSIGAIGYDSRPVLFASNGIQIAVASAGLLYSATLAALVLTLVADGDVPAGIRSMWALDGRLIVVGSASFDIAISDIDDYTSWDPTAIGTRSTTSDHVKAVTGSKEIVVVIGTNSVDFRNNSGDTFPFTPIEDSTVRDCGTDTPDAVVSMHDTPVWFTTDRRVVQFAGVGAQPKRISNSAMEAIWKTYDSVSDARAWIQEDTGRLLYVLTFPSAGADGATFAYDLSTELWFRWERYDSQLARYGAHLGRSSCLFQGVRLIGSRLDGTLYAQKPTVHADGAMPRRWLLRSGTLMNDARPFNIGRFAVLVQAGVGLTDSAAQGYDPRFNAKFSHNGGRTFGMEYPLSMGKLGDYDLIPEVHRLGAGQGGFVSELVGTEPVETAIVNGYVDIVRAA